MSYAVSAALQAAIYDRLVNDAALVALVGDAIYDALPAGELPGLYVSLGPETARDLSDKSHRGATHTVQISVVTSAAGFQSAKQAAAAISDALVDADLILGRGRLIGISFRAAKALRDSAKQVRRIDLSFRARIEDD